MKYVAIILTVLFAAVVAFAVTHKVSPVAWGWWGATYTRAGLALEGYDPVSYFDGAAPLPGRAEFSHRWRNADWRFASAEHLQRFVADPDRYAPQFGGFCAFAVSKGFTAAPSSEAWHVADGRLYVFADGKVRDRWVAELSQGSLARSQKQWARRGER